MSPQFPLKSADNLKVANVCGYCQRKGPLAQSAANKLRDGIVHLTITQLEESKDDGHHPTSQDVARLWEQLILAACEPDCGCAQVLRRHVFCDELRSFWAATSVEQSEGERLSKRQKQNKKKNAKKAEAKDDQPPAPLGKLHSENRRHKKLKARSKQATVPTPTASTAQSSLSGQAAAAESSSYDIEGLQQALPSVLSAAPPAVSPDNPGQTILGLPVTFVATLAVHQKMAE